MTGQVDTIIQYAKNSTYRGQKLLTRQWLFTCYAEDLRNCHLPQADFEEAIRRLGDVLGF